MKSIHQNTISTEIIFPLNDLNIHSEYHIMDETITITVWRTMKNIKISFENTILATSSRRWKYDKWLSYRIVSNLNKMSINISTCRCVTFS